MGASRLDVLKGLVEKSPDDNRLRYMLAMELSNTGNLEGALHEYEAIIANDADYVAAYLQGGHALAKLGLTGQARQFYQRGIEACRRTGDEHTRNELEGILAALD